MKSIQQSALIFASALSLIALLKWRDRQIQRRALRMDPLLALIGSGRHIWADEHADEYIDRLRGDWE